MQDRFPAFVLSLILGMACALVVPFSLASDARIPVILDTDANNELDDQHAIAYLLLNGDAFDLHGITVNSTYNGGDISLHRQEAERVIALCGLAGKVSVFEGAESDFHSIRSQLEHAGHDGAEAVDLIVEQAMQPRDQPLLLLTIGKLTNIALAVEKAPQIRSRIRIVWLGSNYPEPGEYNQDNDPDSLSYLLGQDVPFEMVTVRYGRPGGTDAVKITPNQVTQSLAGTGPVVTPPVQGRHGGDFTTFGDYSASLFRNAELYGDPPARALFDLAAVAIVKNPAWAESRAIPAPRLVDGRWVDQPDNSRVMIVWENFDRDAIIHDLKRTLQNPVPVRTK